jgi:type I restriction enzyme S subunit
MIADLKPYPEYKESGLPWLGKLPAHWRLRRMKFLFSERTEKGFPEEPLLAATQSHGVVRKEDYGTRTVTATKDYHLLKLVNTGDFVISLRSFEGGLEVAHCRGIISPAYTVLIPRKETLQTYYSRFYKSADFISSLTLFVTGIREGQNIDYERLSRAFMPLPPAQEQVAIGQFLDWANGRLERAIRAKRKVIALLNEQKQAIIQRAVTRGLDSSVPLKPSGVPWLGEIPQHWETVRSKWLFTARKELAQVDDIQLSATQSYGVISQADFEARVGRRVVKISMHLEKRRHVEKDDFVISMRSFQGGLERAWATGAIRSSYVVLRKREGHGIDTDFFSYLFKSCGYVRALQSTGDFIRDGQDLNFTNFCRVDLPLIPLKEQRAIANAIADSTRGLDIRNARLGGEIDLLREYRTRLIADVVTGKLDVREAASQLPEEVEPTSADIVTDTDIDPEETEAEAIA